MTRTFLPNTCGMRPGKVFMFSITSGIVAAIILITTNYILMGHYIEELEYNYIFLKLAEGLYIEEEIDAALQAQHFWRIGFPIIMGIGGAVLVSAAYLRGNSSAFIVALAVAAAAWFSLYVIPAWKYPLVPEVLFDPLAASQYTTLFATYSAISGLAALATTIGFAKTGRKGWYYGAAGTYLAIVAGLFVVLPDYPEPEFYDEVLLGSWRSTTAAGMTAFWFILGILAGTLLEREEKKIAEKKS